MKKERIDLYNSCLVRIPLFPIQLWEQYVNDNIVDIEGILKIPNFRESIFWGSESVYESIRKDHIDRKLKKTILKYFSRACSRPTPYGLFGGVGIVPFGTGRTHIILKEQNCNLSLDAAFKTKLKKDCLENRYEELFFVLNPSLHQQYDRIQYLIQCNSDDIKDFEIRTTEASDFLDQVIAVCQYPKSFNQLHADLHLQFQGYDIKDYLKQLINEQILIPLENNRLVNDYCEELRPSLGKIVRQRALPVAAVKNVINKTEPSDALCAHMTLNFADSQLSDKLQNSLLSIVDLCTNDDREWSSILNLKMFRDHFLKRYEGREVPLLEVFDVDNYPLKPYVDEMPIPEIPFLEEFVEILNKKSGENNTSNPDYEILVSRLDSCEIEPTDIFRINSKKIPPTFSALVEVFQDDTFYLKEIGGGSALPLIGRYKQLLPEVKNLIGEISFFEESKTPHIIAEVDFTPFIKAENIVPSTSSYQHVIQIHECKDGDTNIIPLNDIWVGIDQLGKVYLKSKRLEKIIVPRLSNVLNYGRSLLSIYKFLGDLQYQYSTIILDPRFSHDGRSAVFLPRVTYRGNIIQARQWILNRKVIGKVTGLNDFANQLENFIDAYKVDSVLYMVSGDQEFLVNLKNSLFQEIVYDYYKKTGEIKFRERFTDKPRIVKNNNNEEYVNEVAFSFRNQDACYE